VADARKYKTRPLKTNESFAGNNRNVPTTTHENVKKQVTSTPFITGNYRNVTKAFPTIAQVEKS
jgi:hypothetical protein